MNSTQCLFCKIVSGKASSDRVAENEVAIAFRDIHPKAPVHVLIVPREHHATLSEMAAEHTELLGNLLVFAREVADRLKLSGYKVVINVGREGGQIIDHLHLHLLGGWGGKAVKLDV